MQDLDMIVYKMTVCKMLWYSLQDTYMAGLQCNSLQDIGMNAVSKNMVHSLNLDGKWIYDHNDENA